MKHFKSKKVHMVQGGYLPYLTDTEKHFMRVNNQQLQLVTKHVTAVDSQPTNLNIKRGRCVV